MQHWDFFTHDSHNNNKKVHFEETMQIYERKKNYSHTFYSCDSKFKWRTSPAFVFQIIFHLCPTSAHSCHITFIDFLSYKEQVHIIARWNAFNLSFEFVCAGFEDCKKIPTKRQFWSSSIPRLTALASRFFSPFFLPKARDILCPPRNLISFFDV